MTLLDAQLLDITFQHRADVVDVELDGETVVFQPERESLTVLDPVGTVIWTLLDGTATVRVLCAELAEAYEAPMAQIQSDVLPLVTKLNDDGLLDRC